MQLHKLLIDDDAVSPVIGVILMVAITVILAAVIASFVLGIGDQQEVQPTAQFDFDYDASGSNVTITQSSGDAVPNSSVVIRGSGFGDHEGAGASTWTPPGERGWKDPNLPYDPESGWNGTLSGDVDGKSAIVSGDSAIVDVSGDDWELRMVWSSSGGGSTATLAQESGPGA